MLKYYIAMMTLGLFVVSVQAQNMVDVGEEYDRELMKSYGKQILEMPGVTWRHAHTEHFVIHYERKIFATKVARMAESFYEYIIGDLQGAEDQFEGRSHIYVFRDEKDWGYFMQNIHRNPNTAWAFSLASGTELYLQQAKKRQRSGDVLGHEMTHLIMYRVFKRSPPIWLNEGFAEWYEEFAYSAYKGIKKSEAKAFGRLKEYYPLADLLQLTRYPADQEAVRPMYQTSKYLVGYFMKKKPREIFVPFTKDLIKRMPIEDALKKHYDIESVDALIKEFEAFIK